MRGVELFEVALSGTWRNVEDLRVLDGGFGGSVDGPASLASVPLTLIVGVPVGCTPALLFSRVMGVGLLSRARPVCELSWEAGLVDSEASESSFVGLIKLAADGSVGEVGLVDPEPFVEPFNKIGGTS